MFGAFSWLPIPKEVQFGDYAEAIQQAAAMRRHPEYGNMDGRSVRYYWYSWDNKSFGTAWSAAKEYYPLESVIGVCQAIVLVIPHIAAAGRMCRLSKFSGQYGWRPLVSALAKTQSLG